MAFKKFNPETTWLISDLHFGHANIMKYEPTRKTVLGETVGEMNEGLIRRFNGVVGEGDSILLLGDICFDKSTMPLISRLNGKKYLIPGNHDYGSWKDYIDAGIADIAAMYEHPTEFGTVLFSHFPVSNTELRKGFNWQANVHGHVHSHSLDDERYFNVSCEALGFVPVRMSEVLTTLAKRLGKRE